MIISFLNNNFFNLPLSSMIAIFVIAVDILMSKRERDETGYMKSIYNEGNIK